MTSNNEDEKQKLVDPEKGNDNNGNQEVKEKKEDAPVTQEEGPSFGHIFGRFIIAGLFECIGMFLFMCAILLGAGPEATIISFWIIITMISPFSGGHVNPAVTFGCYVYDLKPIAGFPKLIMYILAQLGGGALALMFCTEVRESSEIAMFKTEVTSKEFLSEFFFTGTFIFVILYSCSKITRVSENRALNCVIIASWLYYAATSAGKRSVGALNPAVLTAFAVYNDHIDENYWNTHKNDIWYMYYAHFASALLFAIIFFIVEKMFPDPEKVDKGDNKPAEKTEKVEKVEEKIEVKPE